MTIHSKAYPRAAVIGNPSDGYFGKTIAFVFSNFEATATIKESDQLILGIGDEQLTYRNLPDLISSVIKKGLNEKFKLIQASLIGLKRYAPRHHLRIPHIQLAISIDSTIPLQQGLAGSSAIIIATLKGILKFYDLQMESHWLADIALKIETEILGIEGGLQDRVAQVYERPMFMDFDQDLLEEQGYGNYVPISKDQLPTFYIAYRHDTGNPLDLIKANVSLGRQSPDFGIALQDWLDNI